MKTRIIGKDLEVSSVGLGCMGFTHAYGDPMDENEAVYNLHKAVDMGYSFFDTAHRYVGLWPDGSEAYNEELVGKAFEPYRSKVHIATKCGIHVTADGQRVVDCRPQTIRSELESSLRRLRVDAIDLYYQHRPDPLVPEEEVAGLMEDLIREGKILKWGVSEMDEQTLRTAHGICPVSALQSRYSLMARWNEVIFPVLEELGIAFVAFSPLANGSLSDAYADRVFTEKTDFRTVMPQFSGTGKEKNEPFLAVIREMASSKHVTPAQLSLAWMLEKKDYIIPIPGTRRPERMKENLLASEVSLDAEEMKILDSLAGTYDPQVYGGGAGNQR